MEKEERGSIHLLVLSVMPRDRSVSGFSLHDVTVRSHELRSHQSQATESLSDDIRLDVSVVAARWIMDRGQFEGTLSNGVAIIWIWGSGGDAHFFRAIRNPPDDLIICATTSSISPCVYHRPSLSKSAL